MHSTIRPILPALVLAATLSLPALSLAQPTIADQASKGKELVIRLEEIEVAPPRTSAKTAAPADSRIDILQPQSRVSLNFIANNITPTADYATIASLAPSVANISANGPGFAETKRFMIRGFDDGFYTITYDGIPFGDSDFTHHSTSYFPSKMLGRMDIERGPGTASDPGYANFGGTLALFSKDPRFDAAVIPTVSRGSFNSQLDHVEMNSGAIEKLNGASVIGSFQYINTAGFRTNADMWRRTYYLKYLQPIGQSGATLTVLANYNGIKVYAPSVITQAQINTFGRNYGLGSDPSKIDFKEYLAQQKVADMYYVGLKTPLAAGWRLDNKAYTHSYDNQSNESPTIGSVFSATSMTGAFKTNRYRAWGNILAVSHRGDHGTFKTGLWTEKVDNTRFQYRFDYTRNKALDYDPVTGKTAKSTVGGYVYDMLVYLRTAQPFAEYTWKASSSLTVDAGVKSMDFTRKIAAPINQNSRTPLNYSKTDTAAVPSLSANCRLAPDWSTYAQVAKGFIAPSIIQFYVPNPALNTVKPQESVNYQTGTVYKTDRFNADFNVYAIDYRNFPLSSTDPVTRQPIFALAQGAYFSGAETQFTVQLPAGFNAYVNGSINRAEFKKSKLDVPLVPHSTATIGLLYSHGAVFGSLMNKYLGGYKVYDGTLNPDLAASAGNTQTGPGYWLGDLALGYSKKVKARWLRSYKVKLQVNNLLDRKIQPLDSVKTGVNYYSVLPDRNYFLTISGEF